MDKPVSFYNLLTLPFQTLVDSNLKLPPRIFQIRNSPFNSNLISVMIVKLAMPVLHVI